MPCCGFAAVRIRCGSAFEYAHRYRLQKRNRHLAITFFCLCGIRVYSLHGHHQHCDRCASPHRFDIAFDAASFGAVGLICGGLGCAIGAKASAMGRLPRPGGGGRHGRRLRRVELRVGASLPRGVEPDGIFHLSLALGQALIFAGVVLYTHRAAGQALLLALCIRGTQREQPPSSALSK